VITIFAHDWGPGRSLSVPVVVAVLDHIRHCPSFNVG
jgi:hypothetical protein